MIQAVSDDAERFGQLVDVLLASELPFKESSLGGGEWQVRLDQRQIRIYLLPKARHGRQGIPGGGVLCCHGGSGGGRGRLRGRHWGSYCFTGGWGGGALLTCHPQR